MVEKKSWEQFRSSGLLWWINTILHTFGWSIVIEVDDNNEITNVYPARVKFRGFEGKVNDEGYKKITRYLKDNISDIEKDFTIEEDFKINE